MKYDNKKLYESIMSSVAKEVKKAIDEQYSYNDRILEEYGLSYIFALNEDNSPNVFQKFKEPLQNTLNKIKNKFGNRPCKVIANIVKKAQAHGRLTLYGVLTAITLLSGTLKAGAVTTTEFGDTLSKSVAVSSAKMAQATGNATEENKDALFNEAFDSYVKILSALEDDSKNRYAASGVGCADTKDGATNLAKQDVLSAIRAQYGDDAVEKYDLKFKTICTKSYNQTAIGGSQTKTVSYYTVIMVAYQEVNS